MNLRVFWPSLLVLSSIPLAAWGQASVPPAQASPGSTQDGVEPSGAVPSEPEAGSPEANPSSSSRRKSEDSSGKGSVDLKNGETVYGYLYIWFGDQIRVRLDDGTMRLIPWSEVKECCWLDWKPDITPPTIAIAPVTEPASPAPQGPTKTSEPPKPEAAKSTTV